MEKLIAVLMTVAIPTTWIANDGCPLSLVFGASEFVLFIILSMFSILSQDYDNSAIIP